MPATKVNINGIDELDLNLAGTVTATTAAGVTTITQTGVGGITLETDGVLNGSQTLLNLKSGANISITDDGVGGISIAGSAAGVTSVSGTSPIVSSGGATPAISIADTAVTPGSYTNPAITVDQKGRLTAAASGAAPVTSVTGSAPIVSSGGATPAISVTNATTSAVGVSKPDGTTITINSGILSAVGGANAAIATSTLYPKTVRTTGNVYQNTGTFPLIVVYTDNTASTTPVVALTDASNPPTSQVFSLTSLGGGNGNPCVFLVMPNHFYKVTGTGGLSTWYEWQFNTGTFTASGDLVGSKVLGTVYQNTSVGFKIIEVVISGTSSGSTCLATCDSAASPTSLVAECTSGGSTNSVFFLVPPNYFYKVTVGAGSIAHWNEYASGLSAVQSVNMFTAIDTAPTGPRAINTPCVNSSGKLKFVAVVFNVGATGTSFFNVDENTLPRARQMFQANAASFIRTVYGFLPPTQILNVTFDSGTLSASTAWTEYTLG